MHDKNKLLLPTTTTTNNRSNNIIICYLYLESVKINHMVIINNIGIAIKIIANILTHPNLEGGGWLTCADLLTQPSPQRKGG